jgi:(R,R)-butanediol dehydrogenase/meso-butanediol dehydrogenase/diacetyl reductase
MKAARWYGQRDVRIEEVDEATVGPDEVRIDVDTCGICGSDVHEYAHGPVMVPDDDPHPLTGESAPVTLGHEFSGRISEVGAEVTGFEEGDAVAVNTIHYCDACTQCDRGNYHLCESIGFVGLSGGGGAYAENVVVDAEKAVPLREEVPIEYGALVEPLSVGLHAVRLAGVQPGDTVAVFGSGPIGLAVTQCARTAGARRIFVSEPRTARRERAGDSGADRCLDPTSTDPVEEIQSATDGGVDVAFEAAGVEPAFDGALRATRQRGTMTALGVFMDEVSIQPGMIGERTLTRSTGFQGGPRSHEEYGMVIDMLADDMLDPAPFVTDRIGLDTLVDDGFESLLDDEGDQVKIFVKP